jgi:hypothetical protein
MWGARLQLACASMDALKHQLKTEGYSVATVTGKTLTRQLRALIHASQKREQAC